MSDQISHAGSSARREAITADEYESPQPTKDFAEYLQEYAKQRPDVAALWCFGIGFVLGWKLKPW